VSGAGVARAAAAGASRVSLLLTVKQLHVACALLSLAGFVVRGYWMLRASPLLTRRPVRVLPHVVDTVLLASGVAMAWRYGFGPISQPWLAAKLLALVAYIVLGSVALKRGRTRAVRAGAWVAALGVFGYILAVARSRDPWPFP